jgi:hypothetical protein
MVDYDHADSALEADFQALTIQQDNVKTVIPTE